MRMRLVGLGMLTVPALALAQSSPITPGLWEMAVTIDTVDAPGAPAFVAKMMQGRTTRVRHCITAADAARGPQDLLTSSKTCAFIRYAMANGRLDSAMTCTSGGTTTTSTSTGSFTFTGFTAQGRSVTTGGSMPMTVTNTTSGRLLGACK